MNSFLRISLAVAISLASCANPRPKPVDTKEQTPSTDYASGYEPPLPEPLPHEFRDFQLLPRTQSPDKKFGILFPKRSRFFDVPHRMVLVQWGPFTVINDLPIGPVPGGNREDYCVQWNRDSKAFLLIETERWGPEAVYLVELNGNAKPTFTEFTNPIANKVRPHFMRSEEAKYNNSTEFVFDNEDRLTRSRGGGGILADRGWLFTEEGNVKIDCCCNSNPKGLGERRWKVQWTGILDTKQRRFTQEKLVDQSTPPQH